jgi:hypothetical protein
MVSYDYYGEAKSLAEAAKEAGLFEYASEIMGAMEEGSTGTEIFMILRARLARLILEEKLPLDFMTRARTLYEKLNDALS